MSSRTVHTSVLPEEVLHWLNPQPGQAILDGTLGGGGHTRLLAEQLGEKGRVIALDRDAVALSRAEESLSGLPVMIAQSNFCDAADVLAEIGISKVNGILLDLGLSSDQLADDQRGFSFDHDGPLDLRFDPAQGEPAWRLLAKLREENLANLIYEYGEERKSRRIAREVVARRKSEPVTTARQLAELVCRCVPRSKGQDRIHPATRTFQALRIAVNEELKSLEIALERLPNLLALGGRIAIISFHSLEDRRVKEAFRDDDRLRVLTRKPITPSEVEVSHNPRSRSAKLRVAERVGNSEEPAFAANNKANQTQLRKLPTTKIVSGGQTGVDRAALDVAIELGIDHGGWCPAGRKAEDGRIDEQYALVETDSPEYHVRTGQNVIDSDGTIIFYQSELSGGTKLTHRFAVKHERPFLLLDLKHEVNPKEIRSWIRENRVATLNVAGPRESNSPGIYFRTRELLRDVFQSRNSSK